MFLNIPNKTDMMNKTMVRMKQNKMKVISPVSACLTPDGWSRTEMWVTPKSTLTNMRPMQTRHSKHKEIGM